MKKIIFILTLGLLLVPSFLLGNITQDAASSRVVAVCLWAENTPEAAEYYPKPLGLIDPPIRQEGRICLRLDGAVLFVLKGKPRAAGSDMP